MTGQVRPASPTGQPTPSPLCRLPTGRQGMVRSKTGSTTTMTARNIIPLALLGSTALALVMPTATHAAGFVDDAKVTLGLRNYYFNRNYLNGTDPMIGPATNRERQGQAEG